MTPMTRAFAFSPGAGPYGHKHGRIYSVTRPGLYKVGFRFVDTSTNGPAGGPIQAPSDRFFLYLQGGVTIAAIATTDAGVTLTFGAPSNLPDNGAGAATTHQVESTPALGTPTHWQPVGDAVVGDDLLHTVTAPFSGDSVLFRLVARWGGDAASGLVVDGGGPGDSGTQTR